MDPLMLFALMASIFTTGYFAIKALFNKGLSRIPGALAAAALLFTFAKIILDLSTESSSHNLLPFELIIWNVLGLVIYGLTAIVIAKLSKD